MANANALHRDLVQAQNKLRTVEAELAELKRKVAGLTQLGATPDGAVIVGPVGWHQLQDAGDRAQAERRE